MRYQDGLGHVYDVDQDHIVEFERRLGVLSRIRLAVQLTIIAVLLYIAWH